jgi:chaperonin cofactor prefoldin
MEDYMTNQDNVLSYESICKLVGKLFLDFHIEQERLANHFGKTIAELQEKVNTYKQEQARLEDELQKMRCQVDLLKNDNES